MTGIQTQIMDLAINRYLGTKASWCTGEFAKQADGRQALVGSSVAVAHCAEGAISAATHALMSHSSAGMSHWSESRSETFRAVCIGVERVLMDEHPKLVADYERATNGVIVNHGHNLPVFNDGYLGGAGVGYAGIRAAFEKYYAQCQEKGL